MPTRDETGLIDELIARIPIYPDQEIHLRRRHVDNPTIPDWFDLAQYNVETDRYYLSTPWVADPDVLDAMIAALQRARSTL